MPTEIEAPATTGVVAPAPPVSAEDFSHYPLADIAAPHAHDVLCGRGGGTNNHAGNEKFRELVNDKKRLYLNSSKREKPLVSKSIVEAVRAQRPPGRFLSKNDKTGMWYDIGDQKAREKTSQALREGAPVIRREISTSLALLAAQMSPGQTNGGPPQQHGGRQPVSQARQQQPPIAPHTQHQHAPVGHHHLHHGAAAHPQQRGAAQAGPPPGQQPYQYHQHQHQPHQHHQHQAHHHYQYAHHAHAPPPPGPSRSPQQLSRNSPPGTVGRPTHVARSQTMPAPAVMPPTSPATASVTMGAYGASTAPEDPRAAAAMAAAASITSSQRPPPVDLGSYGAPPPPPNVEYGTTAAPQGEPSLSAASWSSAGAAVPLRAPSAVTAVGQQQQYAPPQVPMQQPPLATAPLSTAVVPGAHPPASLSSRGVSVSSSLSGGVADSASAGVMATVSPRYNKQYPHHRHQHGHQHCKYAIVAGEPPSDPPSRPLVTGPTSRAVSVPHDRGPPPPPDAPPLTEDVEKRLAQAERLAQTTAARGSGGGSSARGKSSPGGDRDNVVAADREAAACHEAGMLGMDPDDLADGLAEGRTVGEMVEEYRVNLLRLSTSVVPLSSANGGSNKDKKPKRMAEWVLPKGGGIDGQSKKKRKSVTRMKIEAALSSIGAF
uniref:DUF6824 domain-containing protein n=2 Tax=Odontella aurita TaxID=265563 RepID=A0A6U6G102_9STRA|mmetsp:Transcript_39138/g.117659  ORF Transcript_39138/g.117659 Transcript_39138/m.117659 type:complete len:658 (+) Transcript_39138:119-2092(+)|eukprot:CAMPEP_0113557158 /NCGR_PEP_ID=MMETSP0015_2-20120614/17638_1 /TAXON_ID=2838 /ORGANISM="Odontella" /LENGTH=657 /DNA_ID=CAMNT_0000458557 /DNA_START=118 /DNA_END=2091 /DNA_ORIENTATION=+ /assembly_acc=CAM_ASM_000160